MNYMKNNKGNAAGTSGKNNKYIITKKDFDKIYYGALRESDFCTCAPSSINISQTQSGIKRYLSSRYGL